MGKYIIEWFPEREIRGSTFCIKNTKPIYYYFGVGWAIFALVIGLLPFFGIGMIGWATWFNIIVNGLCLIWYGYLTFKIVKNRMGNGVPKKW